MNPYYEKLLDLRKRNLSAFSAISPVGKLALLEYEKQKRAESERQQMIEEASR
jgi:hypothetical protein